MQANGADAGGAAAAGDSEGKAAARDAHRQSQQQPRTQSPRRAHSMEVSGTGQPTPAPDVAPCRLELDTAETATKRWAARVKLQRTKFTTTCTHVVKRLCCCLCEAMSHGTGLLPLPDDK